MELLVVQAVPAAEGLVVQTRSAAAARRQIPVVVAVVADPVAVAAATVDLVSSLSATFIHEGDNHADRDWNYT